MTEIYVFSKPGFKKGQSEKLKDPSRAPAILVRKDINSNKDIGLLHSQKDYTLFPTYLEIEANLDLETEKWEISAESFNCWFRKTFEVNNRFDIKKRLQWLSDSGLLIFYCTSIDRLLDSYCGSNDQKNTLEPAENHVAVISNIKGREGKGREEKKEKIQKEKVSPLFGCNESEEFKAFWQEYPGIRRTRRKDCNELWNQKNLDIHADEIMSGLKAYKATEDWIKESGKYIPGPEPFLNQERWRDGVEPTTPPVKAERDPEAWRNDPFWRGCL